MESIERPLAPPNPDAAPYWDGLREGRLMLQSCVSCGTVRHYPRPLCAECHSFEVEWLPSCCMGRVHSWTVIHHAFHPAFEDELPYCLVTVDLAEGVRVNVPLRDAGPHELGIGHRVHIVFERESAALTLPACVLVLRNEDPVV
ncbi:MAG: OB-fold domain-containing protein [Gammaproteobacteria bacterium]|nr:OB-fold domain-containing protein [Gammaproteobacteria bacterium]MBI5618707.1 OB-fold domain-containing protein [Gammaproteobacteria bacterium]